MKTVIVLFGGKSAEHDISIKSAKAILSEIDKKKFKVILCGITKEGYWLEKENAEALLEDRDYSFSEVNPFEILNQGDVVFPIIHGAQGEDGVLQGLFELVGIPYVGCGVLASAVCMDKITTKKVLHKIPQAKYLSVTKDTKIESIEKVLDYPCFIKPANLGSSIGISKASNSAELTEALNIASKYDSRIIVEEFISGREIEVAVLGNEEPIASEPGEILSNANFYDYEAKYLSGNTSLSIPADLSEKQTNIIKKLAVEAYREVGCRGLARVDFFVTGDKILLNEINTMPGFTPFSMYAKLWEQSGIEFKDLITRLIELAITISVK